MTKEPVEKWSGRNFVRRHKMAAGVFSAAVALAFAGAVYVFLWFAGNAVSTGLVPGILGLWSMGNLVSFILNAIFWELLLVGIPLVIGVIVAWQWWRRLPFEERLGYRWRCSKSSSGSGGVSFLFFVAFAIKVFLDGKWNTPISGFTLDYVVSSMFTVLLWGLVVVGILAAIAVARWLTREAGKQAPTM